MSLTPLRDPLLAAARLIIIIFNGLLIAIAAAAVVIGPIMVFLAASGRLPGAAPGAGWALAGLVLLGLGILLTGVQFFRLLRQMIDSVALGDPFIPENATRLAQMGWLLAGATLAEFPFTLILNSLERAYDPAAAGVGMDQLWSDLFNNTVLALVLFILARVFREGARLRADLEGTV